MQVTLSQLETEVQKSRFSCQRERLFKFYKACLYISTARLDQLMYNRVLL